MREKLRRKIIAGLEKDYHGEMFIDVIRPWCTYVLRIENSTAVQICPMPGDKTRNMAEFCIPVINDWLKKHKS